MKKNIYLHPRTEVILVDSLMPIAVSKGYTFNGGEVIPVEEQGDEEIIIDAKEQVFDEDFNWDMGSQEPSDDW